ncbi:resistance protein, partial [Trifolium pratense]
MEAILLKTSVDELLDKLDSTEFVHNFRTTKLDVSLLKELKKTLLKLQAILHYDEKKKKTTNHLTVGDRLDFMRGNAVFQVYNLYHKINSQAKQIYGK